MLDVRVEQELWMDILKFNHQIVDISEYCHSSTNLYIDSAESRGVWKWSLPPRFVKKNIVGTVCNKVVSWVFDGYHNR